jgi:hypothetical protein
VIAFPMVKVGSVIEYTYTLERENFWYIDDWYFQDAIPVAYSSLELKAPLLFKFMEAPFVYGELEQKQDVGSDLIMMGDDLVKMEMLQKNYTMRNLPGVKMEPHMSATDDYMQRIAFQLAQIDYGNGNIKDMRTTWQQVVAQLNLDEDFGTELLKEVPGAAGLLAEAKPIVDTLAKMLKIYNGICGNINWNGSHSIYAMSGLRTVWEKKLGSTGDINLLLVTLLRQAGVEAYPLLASTRSNGLINTAFPAIQQFNVTLACVYIGGRAYVLNAADKYTPYQFIPMEVANTRGLLIGTVYGYRWVDMLVRHDRGQITAVLAEMDANGLLKGEAAVIDQGYGKAEQCKKWHENKSGLLNAHLPKSLPGLKIEDIQAKNLANDSLAMEQKIKFTYPLNSSGGYSYFPLNLFSGFYENPFLGDKRISDIEFGSPQDYTLYGSYTIPEGFVFEELPKDVMMIMPDTSIVFSRSLQAEDNQLRARISLQFKQSYYPVDDYPALQDFYKKLFAKLNEQVVVRKK